MTTLQKMEQKRRALYMVNSPASKYSVQEKKIQLPDLFLCK